MTDFREMGNFRSIKMQLIGVIAGVSVATGLLLGGFFIFSQIQPCGRTPQAECLLR